MTKSTDKAQSVPNKESASPKSSSPNISTGGKRDEQHFWRALKKDDEIPAQPEASPAQPEVSEADKISTTENRTAAALAKPIDLTADIDDLSDEDRENRRHALRSMLDASEARQQSAMRSRRPTPEAGLRVGVSSGPFRGKEGTILDADYIQSRVLLDMEDGQDPQWVEFARLHALIADS